MNNNIFTFTKYCILVITPSGENQFVCFNNQSGYYIDKDIKNSGLYVWESISDAISSLRIISKHYFPTNKGFSFKVVKIVSTADIFDIVIDDNNLFQNI